jgi:Type II secretory pathway, pseudopilin PulG
MKTGIQSRSTHQTAFSLIDLLIVVTVILFLAALILPMLAKARVRSSKMSCVNSLKQVSIAYRIWSGDNGDRFPMQVPAVEGGGMEAVLSGDVVAVYRCMSNELSVPKILICPNDSDRASATNFAALTVSNISYFVGADASETNTFSLLAGDRNITNGTRIVRNTLNLSTNFPSGWTQEIHGRMGNIALADGSVLQTAFSSLQGTIASTGLQTNRIVLP